MSEVDLAEIKDFGAWLRAQPRVVLMGQRALARRSGVDHSTISRILSGEREPLLATAQKLFRAAR